MSPLRICLVCHEYPPAVGGGIGTFTSKMARGLVEAGHEVRVVGVYSEGRDRCENDHGVNVWRLRSKRGPAAWIADRYHLYRIVADWCRRGEIDLIELPDWQGWAALWPRLPVPVIARLHGSSAYFAAEMRQGVKWHTRWLEGASLRRANSWCSVSRYTADRTQLVLETQSGPGAIIYNSVESRPRRSIAERAKNDVVFTGTLTIKKGIVSLIRAWLTVVRAHPTSRLQIYGRDGLSENGGSMTEYLLSLLDERIRHTVIFHGHQTRERVLESLDTARVAVFPSYAEAFALAPLEAMACGCPTIYSQRGSGSELIDHGQDGLLIDPDQPDQISDAIVRLLEDDQLAACLGKKGWKRVHDRFTTKRIVPVNERFYRHCIDEFDTSKRETNKVDR